MKPLFPTLIITLFTIIGCKKEKEKENVNVSGMYGCTVTYTRMIDSVWVDSVFADTLNVTMNEDFSQLYISGFTNLEYYTNNQTFGGYRLGGRFSHDSIYMSHSPELAARWYTYVGKKLK